MTREARLRALAWGACAATVTVSLAGVALIALARIGTSYETQHSIVEDLPDLLTTFVYAIVGAVVTVKRPANLVGWALVLAGLGTLTAGVGAAYGELALLGRPDAALPGGGAAAAFSPGSWTPLMAGVFLVLATFPSGEIGTRRRRCWVVAVLSGFGMVWALLTLSTGQLDSPLDAFDNPLAVSAPADEVLVGAAIPIIFACLGSILVAGIDVVRRFRRSRGLERQQYKWLAASGGLLAVTLPFAAAFNWASVAGVIFSIELLALPVAIGIAVLRYKLFEIDRIVSRALAYGALSVLLGGLYVGLVLGGQTLFSSFAGGSNLAIAVSTLVVAALFLPLRARIQRVVDRRFNRRRYDAQRTLESFGVRLRDQVEVEALGAELCAAVAETMQPAHASLWLRGDSP